MHRGVRPPTRMVAPFVTPRHSTLAAVESLQARQWTRGGAPKGAPCLCHRVHDYYTPRFPYRACSSQTVESGRRPRCEAADDGEAVAGIATVVGEPGESRAAVVAWLLQRFAGAEVLP